MNKRDYAARLRLGMLMTARCSQKQRLVMILRELAASSDAQELAKEILAQVENATDKKGRPPQTVAEWERDNHFVLEAVLLQREKKGSLAAAFRAVSEKNPLAPPPSTLRKRYDRHRRDLETLAKLLSPR